MNAKKIFLLLGAFAATVLNVQAHALWIHTSPIGAIGKEQVVKITYAEPGQNPEKLPEWYSDVKEFELWLTAPDGKKKLLSTTTSDEFVTSKFTPSQEGVYTLSIGHTAKDPGGATVYQFNASALVKVGKAITGNEAANNPNDLSVFADASATYMCNKSVGLTTLYKGSSAEKTYVTVFSPSGWSKQIETDPKGMVEFTPLWPGTYFIEASRSWKEKGIQNGKNYNAVWRTATLLINVKK